MPNAAKQNKITDSERSGSITGIGIILGFSLTFIGQWAHSSQVSRRLIAGACVGAIIQLLMLLVLLSLPTPSVARHNAIISGFALGVGMVVMAFVLYLFL